MSRGLLRFRGYEIVCLAGLALATSVANAESMRCGKWVVTEATTVDELLKKCGQPQSRRVTKDDVYRMNPNGFRVATGTKTVTERWIYQPSSRTLPMAVLVVDGKVVSLGRAD